MTTDQKWAAFELMSASNGTGSDRIIGASLHDCDDKTFAILTAAFPDKMQAAMDAGKQRRAHLESAIDRAKQLLVEHPDLFVKLGSRAENLLERSEKREGSSAPVS
ncbi:MAG TPA: hypothetical protein VMP11_18560 [Verrucomicrobiae bacterium]|nr:hypothetical protein [Verrucomicrobiae bacterium]